MEFHVFGETTNPKLLLLPGLGVSHEIFLPLISLLKEKFYIVTADVDGFLIGKPSTFTSVDDQAVQVNAYVKEHLEGNLDVAYGLSLGGKILSRMMERNEISVSHAVLDAAPLLPLPKWSVGPIRYFQCFNVWTCYHCTGFWRFFLRSRYYGVLFEEMKKVYPSGKGKAVLDGYKSVYTNKLESIQGPDIHYWYGTKEAFVAKSQAEHLVSIYPEAHVEIFPKMNHGQLLVDQPEEIAQRLSEMISSGETA